MFRIQLAFCKSADAFGSLCVSQRLQVWWKAHLLYPWVSGLFLMTSKIEMNDLLTKQNINHWNSFFQNMYILYSFTLGAIQSGDTHWQVGLIQFPKDQTPKDQKPLTGYSQKVLGVFTAVQLRSLSSTQLSHSVGVPQFQMKTGCMDRIWHSNPLMCTKIIILSQRWHCLLPEDTPAMKSSQQKM